MAVRYAREGDTGPGARYAASTEVVGELAEMPVVLREHARKPSEVVTDETSYYVGSYGQAGWASLYNNRQFTGAKMPGEGLPRKLTMASASLHTHASALVRDEVGAKPAATLEAEVLALSQAHVALAYPPTCVVGKAGKPDEVTYPHVETIIKIHGGRKPTRDYHMSRVGTAVGRRGDPAHEEDVERAVKSHESVLVALHKVGGNAVTLDDGTFGLRSLVVDAMESLSIEVALELYGEALARLTRAAREARTAKGVKASAEAEAKMSLAPGGLKGVSTRGCPINFVAEIAHVRDGGLPVAEQKQEVREAVGELMAEMRQELRAEVAAAQSKSKQRQLSPAKRGLEAEAPPRRGLELESLVEAPPSAAKGAGKKGNPATAAAAAIKNDPISAKQKEMADGKVGHKMAAIRALDERVKGTAADGACAWRSLFGVCTKSDCSKCKSCVYVRRHRSALGS